MCGSNCSATTPPPPPGDPRAITLKGPSRGYEIYTGCTKFNLKHMQKRPARPPGPSHTSRALTPGRPASRRWVGGRRTIWTSHKTGITFSSYSPRDRTCFVVDFLKSITPFIGNKYFKERFNIIDFLCKADFKTLGSTLLYAMESRNKSLKL